jgi:AraC-like DNA-binding protein
MPNPSAFPSPPATPTPSLPSLPFGAAYAADLSGPADVLERMSALVAGLSHCTLDPGWQGRLCLLSIGGLRLAATQQAGMDLETQGALPGQRLLLMPFAGRWHLRSGAAPQVATAGEHALLLPPGACRLQGTAGATLWLSVPAERIEHQVRRMCSLPDDAPSGLDLSGPRLLPLHAAGLAMAPVLRALCDLIDTVGGQPHLLTLQGLDDTLLRHLVLMLAPERFVREAPLPPVTGRRAIDRVCQYVLTHLHTRITLGDLEAAGAMSERALQYAFLSRYQCTPMQWVKQQRLREARRLLLRAGGRDSVAQIALACGFVNQGSFAAEYRRVFGELPSETLRTTLRGAQLAGLESSHTSALSR